MIELNDVMRDCLIEANDEYPEYGYIETTMKAVEKYVAITGGPIEMESEEEGAEFLQNSVRFLVDCVLFNLVEEGLFELAGIENGELVFQAIIEF